MKVSVRAGHCRCIYCLTSALLKQETVPYSCSLPPTYLKIKKNNNFFSSLCIFSSLVIL